MTDAEAKGADSRCATVKIKAGESYAIINEADFDPQSHVKFDESSKDESEPETIESKGKGKKRG